MRRVMKEHSEILDIFYIFTGQIKCFPDKVKLKEFIITEPLLCEMLKGLI